MEDVSPTRMGLLMRKAQAQLALQGVELLKSKRDALIREFMKLMDEMFDRRQALEDVSHKAYHALSRCRALDGEETLRSAAMATRRTVDIDIRRRKIWGVAIPDIERTHVDRPVTERGYSFIGVPARVDMTARSFEEVLNAVIDIASTDVLIRRLGDEIRRTTRRVNALEEVLIPRLLEEARYIRATLEEREREDNYRLKKLKSSSGKKGRRGRRMSRSA
jgi:V/A-type H+-transporting ATPase subunit D